MSVTVTDPVGELIYRYEGLSTSEKLHSLTPGGFKAR
jgi:hypothetical protein